MYPLFGGFDSLYHTFAVADTTHVGNLQIRDTLGLSFIYLQKQPGT